MTDNLVKLSFRLPETERRRFRIFALVRGVTSEQALREAFDAWMHRAAAEEIAASKTRPRMRPSERPGKSRPR